MKKNMMTIIVMALAVINLILSAVLIFVVVPASTKTNNLMTKVAEIIDLELQDPEAEETPAEVIKVENLETYKIEQDLTINLKDAGDGKPSYVMCTVALSINTKSKDYKKLNPKVEGQESTIIEIVTNTFGTYTAADAKVKEDEIKTKILDQIQELFQSDFIVNVSFGNKRFQ